MKGRKILITGGASGIGLSTAELFASEGARVALLDRNSNVNHVAKELGGFGAVVDIANEDEVRRSVTQARDSLDGLDGVVNCAGISFPGGVEDGDLASWKLILDVNLVGAFLVTRAAVPYLRANAAATIVNVSSGLALKPEARLGAYVASKAGLLAWTKVIAQELGPTIRVNAICPGVTETPMIQPMLDAGVTAKDLGVGRALGRGGHAIEQAHGILYLTSDESSYVTGIALPIDGGRSYH